MITVTRVAAGILLGIGATIIFRSQLYGIIAVEWTVLLPVGAAMPALSLLVACLSARPWIMIDPREPSDTRECGHSYRGTIR